MTRPQRPRLADFAGRLVCLPDAAESWQRIGPARPAAPVLLLGRGPTTPPPLARPGDAAEIFWLDAPRSCAVLAQAAPQNWRFVSAEEAISLAPQCEIYFYKPGLRLEPEFWSPLLARIEMALQPLPARAAAPRAWLPGDAAMLLHQELAQALAEAGYAVDSHTPASADAAGLSAAFRQGAPDLAISVNFRGLDANGRIFELFRQKKWPLAIWMVDNPWNLLSAIPLPWWREANLFVTDASFIAQLRAHGAKHARVLPLAAAPHMQGATPIPGGPLFVGRSAFPGKEKFFSGARVEKAALDAALAALQAGSWPDFHWWTQKYPASLWPGKGARIAGLGAENCSALRRALWLHVAIAHKLRIVGDAGWRRFLPDVPLLAPVDYYGALPALYAGAEFTLNVTSLLLPQSLSQRHFDVWHAGGFLLSDATRGLGIFPDALAQQITVDAAAELGDKLEYWRAHPRQKQELAQDWRELIARGHLYAHRINSLREALTT